MPPFYNYDWREWRPLPWDVPVKTALTSGEKSYIWRMHLNTPRYLRNELHQQLAIKYNCSVRLVTDWIAERGGSRVTPSPPAHPPRGGRGQERARRQIAGPSTAVGPEVQGREVEVVAGAKAEAGGAAADQPAQGPSKQRRRSSGRVFIEVSTMAEIRAAHRMSLVSRSAEETVTSSSGDGVGSSLRRSSRARKQTEKTRDDVSMKKKQYPKQSHPAEVMSSDGIPTSLAPATTNSSELGAEQTPEVQDNFRRFLEGLHLDRVVPIFVKYGFETAEDVKLIKEMTMDTRKQLFEWFMSDGKVNLKELAILHENLITKK